MNLDLETVLVIATFVTGLICFINWVLTRREVLLADSVAPTLSRRAGDLLVEFARSFFPVLLIVLIIRSFFFEPYKIPSGSMIPTLLVGDFIFVSKFSYGVRLPVLHKKIVDTGSPQRGDVAVFRLPRDPTVNYIKRVIGLPGDQVEYRDHRLTINGEPAGLDTIGPFSLGDSHGLLLRESIDGRDHELLHTSPNLSFPAELVVPDDCYFVMGDNRDNSQDSRFTQVGCIPETNLVGKAGRIWFNWEWPGSPRWKRIGLKIQ